MNSVDGTIQMRSGKALACALLIMASNPSETLAQSRRTDPDLGSFKTSFLSEPRDEAARPAEVPPGSAPLQNNRAFDGAWTFTSAGCRYTGTLPAMIVDGKIIVKGGSGQVDPDGTLHSVGAGNGMTLTAVGTPDLEHSIDPMAVSVAGSLSSGELGADAHYGSCQPAQAGR